jgi:hypothetical protein
LKIPPKLDHAKTLMNDPAGSNLLATLHHHEATIWEALLTGDGDGDGAALAENFLGVYSDGFAGKAEHTGQRAKGPTITAYLPTIRPSPAPTCPRMRSSELPGGVSAGEQPRERGDVCQLDLAKGRSGLAQHFQPGHPGYLLIGHLLIVHHDPVQASQLAM